MPSAKSFKPINNNGSIAVRFTYPKGQRRTIPLGGEYGDPKAMKTAQEACDRIYEDILTNRFDFSEARYRNVIDRTEADRRRREEIDRLHQMREEESKRLAQEADRYRRSEKNPSSFEKAVKKLEKVNTALERDRKQKEQKEYIEAIKFRPTLELFREFVAFKWDKLQYSSATTYRQLLNRLEEIPNAVVAEDSSLEDRLKTNFPYNADRARDFLKNLRSHKKGTALSQKTQKNYATCFTAFGEWLIEHKNYTQDPYDRLKIDVAEKPKPKPFTLEEANQIIGYFQAKYPAYANFVCLRFLTGLRSGELAGLRWSDVDWDNQVILVYSSITQAGESGKLVRKSTKTGKGREITFTPEILEILAKQRDFLDQKPKLKDHELIFPNEYANPINSSHFSEKYWKPTLMALGIPHENRNPYKTRSTFGTHALRSGVRPEDVARILGHDVQTFFKHYEGEISRPEMPRLGLSIPNTNSENL